MHPEQSGITIHDYMKIANVYSAIARELSDSVVSSNERRFLKLERTIRVLSAKISSLEHDLGVLKDLYYSEERPDNEEGEDV